MHLMRLLYILRMCYQVFSVHERVGRRHRGHKGVEEGRRDPRGVESRPRGAGDGEEDRQVRDVPLDLRGHRQRDR